MLRNSLIIGVAFCVLAFLMPQVSSAEADNFALPAGSTAWRYDCKAGSQCPTKCAIQGADLFATANYISLTVAKLPDRTFWVQINTGVVPINYIVQADSVMCSVAGAILR
jgi:hypothetical protein